MDNNDYQNPLEALEEDFSDEDISQLEDNPDEDGFEEGNVVLAALTEAIDPDAPLYQLRLTYSHETFLAAFSGEALRHGQKVLVPTKYGLDLASVIGLIKNREGGGRKSMSRIVRIASPEDLEKARQNKALEEEAFHLCKEKIISHKLDMKLVSVHYLLEEPKVLFFFTSENRVDFRDLVKDLVAIFKIRIELRQIGVRDDSRVVGGMGICGRGYCCHLVSDKLKPVSIKMAKDQTLSLNSMKISGPCGRLLCCLAYEHNYYAEQRRLMPSEGCKIQYEGSLWKVRELNVAAETVCLCTEDGRQVYLPVQSFVKADGRWTVCSSA
jgi:cell fate regulator YaaT (PSP1 superfamily)